MYIHVYIHILFFQREKSVWDCNASNPIICGQRSKNNLKHFNENLQLILQLFLL